MSRRLKMVFLDDHCLFRSGVLSAIDPEKKIFFVQAFAHSADALRYISNSLDSGERIDLIVTDFMHPGADGYEFARSVRNYEAAFSVRIPILLLTLYSQDYDSIRKGLKESIFSGYLSKAADKYQIRRDIGQLVNVDLSRAD